MTDNQLNTANMANAVTDVMDNNLALWTANAKITAAVNAVKGTITNINTAAGVQAQSAKGTTQSKNQLWAVAAAKAEHVCVGLKAYCDDVNDAVLAAIINFSPSDFEKGSGQVCANRMQLVHDKATGIAIATLTPFGIVATDITGLQTAVTNFVNALPNRTSMVAGTSAATANLATLFSTLRTQLGKLDNLVGTMKVAQPTFVATYTNARKIINLGKTQQAVEVHLLPHHFEAEFGMKFSEGDTLTVRNHSNVPIILALTDTPNVMPTAGLRDVPPQQEFKLVVPADFGGVFGHWLMVHNPQDIEDAHVTIILAHGKSNSQAASPGNVSA